MKTLFLSAARAVAAIVIAAFPLAGSALCSTWIVDVNNGPGTNFTSIIAAVAASAPGDVIRVRQGSYGGFTLGRGMTILGEGTVYVGKIQVYGVPAGDVALISQLVPQGVQSFIDVWNCAGTVILQEELGYTLVSASRDVRILRYNEFGVQNPGNLLVVKDSRVQAVQSRFHGWDGYDSDCNSPAEEGYAGIDVRGASRLHVALTEAEGGKGGAGCGGFYFGAYGGPGITAEQTAATGLQELILCGGGGIGSATGGPGGTGAPSPFGGSLVLRWNVLARSSQMSYVPTQPQTIMGATFVVQPTTEPTLELIGIGLPGSTVTLRLRATPGTAVRLNAGRKPALNTAPGVLIENLVLKERSFDRGTVPPSGILDTPWLTQPGAPIGQLLLFQAAVHDPSSGLTQKSNSIELVVH